MNILLIVIILSVVEGLTEFLPVSSTGHLILFGERLNFDGGKADFFSVFIQLGAILSVVVLYKEKFLSLLDFKSSASFSGYLGLQKIFIASLPAMIFGFLTYDYIKEHLFSSLTVAIALVIGGIVLIFIEKLPLKKDKQSFEDLSLKDCLIIGSAQCCALWPGMSRSGSTIVGALLLGAEKKLAAEFSFFLAVPIMFLATAYDFYKSYHLLSVSDLPYFALGFILSFVCAYLAIRFFIKLLERFSFAPFGYYRILLGLIVIILL